MTDYKMTREEAIEILNNVSFFAPSEINVDKALDMAIEALNGRPQGEWKFVDHEVFAGEYFCSICGKRAEVDLYGEWILSNYCGHCGTRMKGGEDE